ncbi:MAG: glycosyltransferase [Chitinophagaceae bacterium]|nr:MAG: glycosyltransferase [Chitinophagaceae bacterium]
MNLYRKFFGALNISFLPAFNGWDKVDSLEGRGNYCLYHGNLGINENEKAVKWLLNHVFKGSDIPLIVAGKRPSESLEKFMEEFTNCSLVENPTDHELQDLIHKAQVNVLPSFNNTGVKLKLLNALYNGRHCVVNSAAVEGASIPNICVVADEPTDFLAKTTALFQQPFTTADMQQREKVLSEYYNNETNAAAIVALLKK